MKKAIAPHRVRLAIRSYFQESLCFPWGSPYGYVTARDIRLLRRPRSGAYILIHQDRAGSRIEPPELRIGDRKGEMTFCARMFLCTEVVPA